MYILEDNVVEVTIEAGESLSTPFDMRKYGRLLMLIPAEWTAANFALYHSDSESGDYYPVRQYDGNLAQMVISTNGCWYGISPNWSHAHLFVRLWSQNAGVDVPQAAKRIIKVAMKT